MVKEGGVIIDAGYNPENVGDVSREAYEIASAYTPVPGGVGPMTINMLLTQTVASFRKKMEK
jgi:methylenetetrahydrofolate dehydrogenase (NADP+)/methenyltetrahydrofolate cyclohydrolase